MSRVHPDARILNLTSMAGVVSSGTIGMSAYCASKHAANAFSNILRAEIYHSFHIQVTTINPSFHGTPLVYTMGDVAAKQWDTLDTTKKMEYGEGNAATAKKRS
jgi:NAD(P)-dependent dehydrogenase (short-subunit alcohol dehydrogenase family)